MSKMRKIICIVGPPMSGKKTQANRLCESFGYKQVFVPNDLNPYVFQLPKLIENFET